MKYDELCTLFFLWDFENVSTCCSGLKQEMFYASGEESVKRNSGGDDLAPAIQNGEKMAEWDKTSPPREDQWDQTSVSHSDNWVMSTTWDMQLDCTGEEGCRLEPVE